MIDEYIQQLSSNDPSVRRAAIIALGKSGDTRALRPLSTVIKTDPDDNLRTLALKAGRHLRGLDGQITLPPPSAAGSSGTRKPSSSTANRVFTDLPDIDAPGIVPLDILDQQNMPSAFAIVPEVPVEKPRRLPTAQDKKLAKGKLDQAIGLKMAGDNVKAYAALVDAVHRDPDLAHDVVALNLAANVSDIKSPQEAMEAIVEEAGKRPQAKSGFQMPSFRRADGSVDPAVFNLVLEIAILVVVSVIFGITLNFGVINVLTTLLRLTSRANLETATLQTAMRSITPMTLLVGAVRSGVLLALTTVISYVISYIIGSMRGGSGDMFKFLGTLIRAGIVFLLLQTLFLAMAVAGLLLPGPDQPPITALIAVGGALFGLSGFVEWLTLGYLASKAHNFGFLRGLFVISIGSLLAGFLWNLLGIYR